MSYDAIDDLIGCGYSERVAIATHFLRRAAEVGHVTEMPCAENRLIYHLSNKRVYGMVGQRASQSRRVKSPREILRRLMALDYVLLHIDCERFLETNEARRQLFTQLRVKQESIDRSEEFAHTVPVSLIGSAESAIVRFAFIDEGQRSRSMFARFLTTHKQLLCGLPNVEIVYVSLSPAPFSQARHVFERHMPLRNAVSPACPLGVEHLVRWLKTQHQFHHGHGAIAPAEHQLFLEGQSIYRAPVHMGLVASWKNGAMNADKVRELLRVDAHRVSFVTELLDTDYPRSIDSAAGYTTGYDDLQKCLFDKDLEGVGQANPKN